MVLLRMNRSWIEGPLPGGAARVRQRKALAGRHSNRIAPAANQLPSIYLFPASIPGIRSHPSAGAPMRPSLAFLATFLFLISAQPTTRAALPQTSASHDRTFWRNIIKNNYRVPPDQSVFPLVQELSSYLGSPDPELRDDIAYTLINAWIAYQKQLSPQEVIAFADEWQSNLRIGI